MNFFTKKIKKGLLLGFALCSFTIGSLGLSHACLFEDEVTKKEEVLNTCPKSKAYAGVLPYAKTPEGTFFLLSQEAKGKDKGTLADCGGKVDFNPKTKKNYRFVSGALNELTQESCTVYDLSPNGAQLLKDKALIYHTDTAMMAYLELPYKPISTFDNARNDLINKKANHCFLEKDQFYWVEAKSLLEAVEGSPLDKGHKNVSVATLNDNKQISEEKLILRGAFAHSLQNSKKLLEKIAVPQQAVLVPQAVPAPQVAAAPRLTYSYEEIDSVSALLDPIKLAQIGPDTVICVDLDETLVFSKRHLRKDIDPKHLNGQPYVAIEPDIAKTMSQLKNANGHQITILGLTKRRYTNVATEQGHVQAEKLGIPFSRKIYNKYNNLLLSNTNKNIIFDNGVIYTANQNKGHYLGKFLDTVNRKPKHIIMVDDKPKNLNDVYDFAKSRNISLHSYQMNGAEKFKK